MKIHAMVFMVFCAVQSFNIIMPVANPLKVIGLTSDATTQEIKKQCRTLLLKHHADKGGGDVEATKIIAACDDLDWRGKDTCNRAQGPLGASCVCPTTGVHSQCIKGFTDTAYRCSCPLSTTEDTSLVSHYDYQVWKQNKRSAWKNSGVVALENQVKDLLAVFNNHKDKEWDYAQSEALYAYNFLRELLKQPIEKSYKTAWIDTVAYDFFKKETIQEMEKAGIKTPHAQIHFLLDNIDELLGRVRYLSWYMKFFYTVQGEEQQIIDAEKRALLYYNFARELLGEQPVTVMDNERLAFMKWWDAQQSAWEKVGMHAPLDQVKDLLNTLEPGGFVWFRQMWHSKDQFYAYNLLRSLLGQTPAQWVDTKWLRHVKKDPAYAIKHAQEKYNDTILWDKADYELWKTEGLPKVYGLSSRPDRIFLLKIKDFKDELREHPENKALEREIIYSYNFLRKLVHEPFISSIKQVDDAWLETVSYKIWKKDKQARFEAAGIKLLADQYKDLITIIEPTGFEWAQQLLFSNDQLYAFNYLRELLGQPPVSAIGPQEKEWLEQIKKQYK